MPEESGSTIMGLDEKLSLLANVLRGMGPFLLAFSGGLDSRVLAGLALRFGARVQGLHIAGPHVPAAETAFAARTAESMGLRLHMLELDPLGLPEVRANARQRCYHCKRFLFEAATRKAGELGLAAVADGSQLSDLGEHRPGRRALAELGVRSPLAEAGLGKPELREAARLHGVEGWDQPSRPCLLTRFPYDTPIDAALLARTAEAERLLAAAGLRDFRLRQRPGERERAFLQVTPPEADMAAAMLTVLADELARLGFVGVGLAATESLSGFWDREEMERQSLGAVENPTSEEDEFGAFKQDMTHDEDWN